MSSQHGPNLSIHVPVPTNPQIPNANGTIAAPADHEARFHHIPIFHPPPTPILIELPTQHAPCVSPQCCNQLPSEQVPHHDRLVPRARNDPCGVKFKTINT